MLVASWYTEPNNDLNKSIKVRTKDLSIMQLVDDHKHQSIVSLDCVQSRRGIITAPKLILHLNCFI